MATSSNVRLRELAEIIRAKRDEVEKAQDWFGEAETMPLLRFPSEWQIQIIPPFRDVAVRFRVTLPSGLKKSVFLDNRGSLSLGGYPPPYWEVSPVAGKVGRCHKYEIDILLELIAYEEEE